MKPRPKGARGLSKDLRNQLGSTRPSVRHGYFRSFDGTKIFYSIEGTGRPLIFCYGLVCSSLHWTYQIDYFRRNYQTIWLDYRGHQNSEVPKDLKSLTIKNIACDVGLLLDEIGIENAVFLGHSMGVNIVLELYRQRPQQVAAMVLANGTPKPPLETMFHRNITQAGFPYLKKAYDLSPGLVSWLWKKTKQDGAHQEFGRASWV
jgi:pimeloyl-ACP methyl ester carboxylesterase